MLGFTEMHCGECGIIFHVPDAFYKERRERRLGWHCPNGHSRIFGETVSDQLRRERDQLKQRIAERDDEVRHQREQREAAERTAAAYKGQATKLRKRAKAGVCPCCTRSFQDLKRHMATKHPNFGPDEPLKVIQGGKAA